MELADAKRLEEPEKENAELKKCAKLLKSQPTLDL